MTGDEHKQAARALINWFDSQDIMPADAGMIMSLVIATSLVDKTKDVNKLGNAIKLFNLMIACDVADLIRA